MIKDALKRALWFAAFALGGLALIVTLSVLLVLVAYYVVTNDSRPPLGEMTAYFNANREDFEQAAPMLLELQCSYTCSAPESIRDWAGADAQLYFCYGKEDPPMYDIITDGGTFTYIPDQDEIPSPWNPCVGVLASCSTKITDDWFICRRQFD